MPFQIIRNDITKVRADAIVNTANPRPAYAAGTDAAVYQAAGAEALLHERQKIGRIGRGDAVVTSGFALPAKYIIHTVGPAWIDGKHGEFKVLADCYQNSLELAAALRCGSIAFPLIATGVYGFPKDRALDTAVSVIRAFLEGHEMQVTLVVFDRNSFVLSGQIFRDVDAYIDDNHASVGRREEFLRSAGAERADQRQTMPHGRAEEKRNLSGIQLTSPTVPQERIRIPSPPPASLEDALENVGDSFQQRLLTLIDRRGLTDPEVYKKANLDRKHFSKIRGNPDYRPKKKTALALAVALELNVEETADLLRRAGLAFSPSSKSDLIIQYFISRKKYDLDEINLALFDHGRPLLGA